MKPNIITLTFSNETIAHCEQGIADLLSLYANETEPFVIIADYTGYKDNGVVPQWIRLRALFQTWAVARDSQWVKVYIAIAPTPESNFFLRWCQLAMGRAWVTHIVNDIDDAYRIVSDEAILSLHQ